MGDVVGLSNVSLLVTVAIIWAVWRFSPARSAQRHFDAGRGEKVLEMLPQLPPELSAPFAVALGRYREAFKLLDPAKNQLDDEERVIAAEALRELGRFDEVVELLRLPARAVNIEASRRCCLTKTLVSLGRIDEARERLRAVNVHLLAREKFDALRTQAIVHLGATEFDLCEAALHNAAAAPMTNAEHRDSNFFAPNFNVCAVTSLARSRTSKPARNTSGDGRAATAFFRGEIY